MPRTTSRGKTAGLAAAFAASLAASVVLGQGITTDYSGEWSVVRSQDNTENPWVGDFFGLPFNDDGLARRAGTRPCCRFPAKTAIRP